MKKTLSPLQAIISWTFRLSCFFGGVVVGFGLVYGPDLFTPMTPEVFSLLASVAFFAYIIVFAVHILLDVITLFTQKKVADIIPVFSTMIVLFLLIMIV